MKKISLLGVMVLSLLLIGCGNNETVNQDETEISKSDCIKWCEMMWGPETSKERTLADCTALCEAGIAIEKNDVVGCERLQGTMKNACYSSIAYETANAILCGKIEKDSLMEFSCYSSIAEKTKDTDVCEKVTDATWKISCEQNAKAK